MTDAEYKEYAIELIYYYYEGKYTRIEIDTNYPLAVNLLVDNLKNNTAKIPGVKSVSEGNQSMSYNDNYESFTLTSDVLALLPKKVNIKVW